MHFKFKFLATGIVLLLALPGCTQSDDGSAEKASAEAPAEAPAAEASPPESTTQVTSQLEKFKKWGSSETSDSSESKDKTATSTPAATAEEKPAAVEEPAPSEPAAAETADPAKPAEEAPASTAPAEPAASADTPYTVVDGKIDKDTFTGWQTYRTTGCGQCHGGAGQGGAAPSLVDRLKTIDQAQFNKSVLEGKNLMPPWKGNPKVVENIDKIYAYLKARSDGALGEGKPEVQ